MRLSNEELDKIKLKYGVNELWSYSRIDCFRNSKYEYFLRYVKHEDPLGETSPYGILGGEAHDCIERFYSNEIKYEDMADEFQNAFVANIDMLDLKFNRIDEEKNKSIRNKYYDSLMHYFKNFHPLDYKVMCEKFVAIKVTDDIVLQGYIDCVYKDKHGVYHIVDWKTSTAYKGKAIEQHSHQLTIYAEALRQSGVPADKIQIEWGFLKYVTVLYEQINGKLTESQIERCEIGKKLVAKAKSWLKHLDFSTSEIDEFANEMQISNSIDCLPEEVRNKFQIDDCYIEIPNWQSIWEDLREEIIATVGEIRKNTEEYNKTGDDKLWWDDDSKLAESEYYLWNLTSFSVSQLADFKDYLDRQEKEKNMNNDLLGTTIDNDLKWLEDL